MSGRSIIVWGEIPVTDMEKSVAFYNAVFGYDMTIDTSGPNPMAVLGGSMGDASGHLYPGVPAPDGGSTIHLGLTDTLEEGVARCKAAGGQIIGDPVEMPFGRFAYAKDLDGNSIGLFQAAS